MGRTRQYAGRVNVIKRIKVGDRWPFAPVVEKNGKLVRDHVRVSGRDEHHPEGRYYLDWDTLNDPEAFVGQLSQNLSITQKTCCAN